MSSNRVWKELRALFFLDFAKFKNYLVDAARHPGKLIGLLLQYGLQFVWLLPLLFLRSNKPTVPWALSLDALGAGVMALLVLIFFSGMNKASVKYAPGQYSMGDVNFLFPSPISQRTVYAWSMLREMISSLYLALIGVIYLPFISLLIGLSMDASKLAYTAITIIIISVLASALNFFIYSVSHRFGIGKIIKIAIRLMTIGLLAYTAWGALTADSILEGLLVTVNGSVFSNIPVIGWAKTLIMSPFIAISSPLPLLLGLLATAIIIVVLAVHFAVDYYEEAISVAEWVKSVSSGNIETTASSEEPKKKGRHVDVGWSTNGPWAFIWKQAVANKRASRFMILGWDQLLLLIVGIIFGFIASADFSEVAGYIIGYATTYVLFIGSIPVGLQYELRKQYIYTLPGRPMYKILAINTLSSAKAVIRGAALVLPIWILAKLNIYQALAIWLFSSSVDIMTLFSGVLINIALPFYDAKNILQTYLRMAVQVLSMLPAILPAIIAGVAMNSMVAPFYAFAAGTPVALALLLYIAEKLFARMEMK
ncbi:MAG: hypothetical protein PWP48_713 [Clostridiales bacterium]|nr:hypothetical protein [Clostridiales bacterium]MDK2991480.1 hypothetical protein [Clostridiales bacterium]